METLGGGGFRLHSQMFFIYVSFCKFERGSKISSRVPRLSSDITIRDLFDANASFVHSQTTEDHTHGSSARVEVQRS